jgi:oxygen-independent coproporphyrinogen-3 oxidase
MRVHAIDDGANSMSALVVEHAVADYVYMYPPRQAYRPVDQAELGAAIGRSLQATRDIDLYLHFPFCKQICAFCNLYAVVESDQSVFADYATMLLREAQTYAGQVAGKPIRTLYLGGGTPSQIQPEIFDELLRSLERQYEFDVTDVREVALEVAPDTVSADRLAGYVAVGINRVNLGMQSASDAELHAIGRRHDAKVPLSAIETALSAGFRNVCVDLIYGLEGQTLDSWMRSVDAVAELRPPTICAYALTLRPWTGFNARGYKHISAPEQYAKYDYVTDKLRTAGYRQETHVRWALGTEGGYLQKERHWALSNILGLGAGARGYLWECDYRNGYSVRHRIGALRRWRKQVSEHGHGRSDGFLMSDDERRRKMVILGLNDLDRARFLDLFGEDPLEVFPAEFASLSGAGLIDVTDERVQLTHEGNRHRDVAVQAFFSQGVRDAVASFDYDE